MEHFPDCGFTAAKDAEALRDALQSLADLLDLYIEAGRIWVKGATITAEEAGQLAFYMSTAAASWERVIDLFPVALGDADNPARLTSRKPRVN